MQSSSEDEFVRSVCDASSRNDGSKVAILLGCRRLTSPCLDEPLLTSTRQAEALRARVFAVNDKTKVQGNSSNPRLPENTRPEHAARALLIAPTAYEVPWVSACEFVTYLHKECNDSRFSSSRSFLRSSIADIQSFLQQTVAAWWEEDRKQTAANKAPRSVRPAVGEELSSRNPRHWILRLVQVVMEPLYQVDRDPLESTDVSTTGITPQKLGDNSHWTVPLELISTIVSLSRDLEASLFEACLDLVFQQPIKPDCILPWVGLASELRLFLRNGDWKALHQTLRRVLTTEPCPVHRQDLPGLAEGILSLSSALASKRNFQQDDLAPWKELVLQLLYVASCDLATFSTVETILQLNLGALPSSGLQQWVAAATTIETSSVTSALSLPTWVHANMLLLVLRAVSQSGSQLVSKLVARALGGTDGFDLATECWNQLVDIMVASVGTSGQDNGGGKNTGAVVGALKRLLDGVSYAGQGRFKKSDGTEEAKLSAVGATVFESLFLGHDLPQQRSARMHVMERAQAWVHAVNSALESPGQGGQDSPECMLMLVVFIVVFCDVPMSRSSLTRGMIQSFAGGTSPGADAIDAATLHCLVVSVVLQGTDDERFKSGELDQVADIFSKPVPVSLFFDLSKALSPLPSVRRALLSAARKGLQAPYATDLWWATGTSSRGAKESSDRVKCGLFALCTLICTAEWGSLELEAWTLLSDTIVSCKPPLPTPTRAWLFSQLKGMLQDESLSVVAAEHVLRACLVRFLSFCGSDSYERVCFVPEKLFVVWENKAERLANRSKQLDDVVGLLDLVQALVHYTVDKGQEKEEKIGLMSSVRRTLATGVQTYREKQSTTSSQDVRLGGNDCAPMKCSGIDLLLETALHCNVVLLQCVLGRNFLFQGIGLPSAGDMVASLVSLEAECLQVVKRDCLLPAWLSPPRHAIGTLSSKMALPVNEDRTDLLRAALCDIVSEFLVGPRWSFARPDNDSVSSQSQLGRSSFGVASVLTVKRQLVQSSCAEQQAGVMLSCSTETVCSIFEAYCRSSFRFLEAAITNEGGRLEDIDEIIAGVLDLCVTLGRCCDAGEFDSGHCVRDQLVVLWELYTALCGEESVVRLIAYLESQELVSNAADERTPEMCSLLSIRSGDEIDTAVRRIRSTILVTIGSYFTCVDRQLRLSSGVSRDGSEDSVGSSKVMIKFLGALSRDLRLGLDGASGGLTGELFLAYVDCIEVSANILSCLLLTMSAGEKRAVSASCTEAAKALEAILCSVSLKGSALFKKTMALTIGTIPSVSQQALRSLLLHTSSGASETTTKTAFVVTSLEQCLDAMPRNHKDSLEPPAAGVGSRTAQKEDASDSEREEDDAVNTGLSTAITVSSNTLQLASAKMVHWALASVFCACEEMCNESLQVVQRSSLVFRSQIGVNAYFVMRKREFGEIFRCIALVFKATDQRDIGSQGKRTERDTLLQSLVVILPATVKLRLTALLDRTLVVLHRGLQAIMKSFQSKVETATHRLAIVESLSCVAAWLELRVGAAELTLAPRAWFDAEKRLVALPRTGPHVHTSETSVLRRLPKIMLRIEELDATLSRTSQLATAIKADERKVRPNNVLQDMDALFAGSERSAHGEDSETEPFEVRLSSKCTYLEEQRVALDAKLGSSSTGKTRKRKSVQAVGRLVQKERRRRVVRSRNQTVDKWLQMDQTIGQDEVTDGDAYADLEDFLADG